MIQRDWIDKLVKINNVGKPILTTKHWETPDGEITMGSWVPLSTNPMIVDYRTILHNEIVFDIDFKDWKYVKQYAEKLQIYLDQKGVPYLMGMTGGKGMHFHIFMDIKVPQEMTEEVLKVKKKGYTLRNLRVDVWRSILNEINIDDNLIGRGKPFDDCVVNFDDNSKGHVIRAFGGRNPQGKDELKKPIYYYKYLVTDVPETKIRLKEMPKEFPSKIELWNLPISYIKNSINNFLKMNSSPEKPREIKKYNGLYTTLPCVQHALMTGSDEGQRHDGAVIIAIACALDKLDDEQTMDILKRYHKACEERGGSQFSLKELKGWVEWLKNKPLEDIYWDKDRTCNLSKGLNFASSTHCEKCPLNLSIHKESINFLSNSNIITELQTEFEKVMVNEKENRMLLYFCYLSAYMDEKIHPQLIGESSIGKSFMLNKVLSFVPDEDLLTSLTGASAKSFNYYLTQNPNIPKIELNGVMVPNIDGKIIVVQEFEGAQDAVITLRPLMSGDQKGIKSITVEKDAAGRNNYKEMTAYGMPVFATATTNFGLDKEFLTRTWRLELDEGPEQTRNVILFQSDEDIDKGCHVSDKLELIKDSIRLLKTQCNSVINPYSSLLAKKMPIGSDSAFIRLRRDFKKIKEFIKICAWIHQLQRPKIKIGEDTHILATLEDYWIVKKLIEPSFEMIFAGNESMKKCFRIIKDLTDNPEYGEYGDPREITTTLIAEKTGWSQTKARNVLKDLGGKGLVLSTKAKGKSYSFKLREKETPVFPELTKDDLKEHYNEMIKNKPNVAEMLDKIME